MDEVAYSAMYDATFHVAACHPCSLRFDEYYFFNPYNHAHNIVFFIPCCHIWASVNHQSFSQFVNGKSVNSAEGKSNNWSIHKRNKNHTNLHYKGYLNIAHFHQPSTNLVTAFKEN